MLLQFWQQPSHLIALKARSRAYSYGELQQAVSQWIVFLNQDSHIEQRNGFFFDDPFFADSFILAHMFSGRTFVPLNRFWSPAVREKVIKDLRLTTIFSDAEAREILIPSGTQTQKPKELLLQNGPPPEGLMALFMTSGSTGVSKAVGIEFGNFWVLMNFLFCNYPLAKETKVAQCFQPIFDPYYAMIFLTYAQGGTLVYLYPEHHFQIAKFCGDHQIEIFASVPTLAELGISRNQEPCQSLKKTFFTGEALTADLVRKWQQFAPNSEIENFYGPVETTVWVTKYRVNLSQPVPSKIPIGKPWGETRLEIHEGQLLIQGPQVGKGYLREGRWDLFEHKFFTGDRVEKDINGDFVYLGRKESLLKISGERIDLEEIESEVLTRFHLPCCLIWSEVNHGLNLFMTKDEDSRPIEQYLSTILTRRFQLKKVWKISEWPRTPSGKVDRNKMAAMVRADF
jgi:D-alanine--poly(phosphoribitol) ligase subunit 1